MEAVLVYERFFSFVSLGEVLARPEAVESTQVQAPGCCFHSKRLERLPSEEVVPKPSAVVH